MPHMVPPIPFRGPRALIPSLLLGVVASCLTACPAGPEPTPTPTGTPRPPATTPLDTPMAGVAAYGWLGTIHTATDDPTCDDYFLRDADGQRYGISGETAALSDHLITLRDTSIPVIITGTLYAHVADMRGLCIIVREIRRTDETPTPPPPTATPVPPTPTSTDTPSPTSTPTETPLPTDTPVPTETPTQTPLPTLTDTPTAIPPTPILPPTATLLPTPTSTLLPVTGSAWSAEYFANSSLSGPPAVVRQEGTATELNWSWGSGSPAAELPADGFSARWIGVIFLRPVHHRFLAYADDGVRVYLDGQLIIDEWHEWQHEVYSVDMPISMGGRHLIVVEYLEQSGDARVWVDWEQLDYFTGWKGEYFNSSVPGTEWVMTRNDAQVNFDWAVDSPHYSVDADEFSVRWTRGMSLLPGSYRFWVRADDGVRMWLDGNPIFDAWYDGVREFSTVVEGISADYHTITIEYYDRGDRAFVHIWWEFLGIQPGEAVP